MRRVIARPRKRALVCYAAVLAACASLAPASAHHVIQRPEGAPFGVVIPAISHGETLLLANYRAEIMDLAAREPRTDPTLRRLQDFVSLQYFACFRGLVPGSLTDERSPFNECAHAYLAGARALLAHMTEMPGDQSAAKALQARIAADLAGAPGPGAICSNSNETFDSGVIIGPDWSLVPTHPPTLLTFSGLALLAGVGWMSFVGRRGWVDRSARQGQAPNRKPAP